MDRHGPDTEPMGRADQADRHPGLCKKRVNRSRRNNNRKELIFMGSRCWAAEGKHRGLNDASRRGGGGG